MQTAWYRSISVLTTIFLAASLTGCATMPPQNSRQFIAGYGVVNPDPTAFKVCYSHDCSKSVNVHLSPDRWSRVRAFFDPPSRDPGEERERLGRVIGEMETAVGEVTGLDQDVAGTFTGIFRKNQMDCVDEAINTSTYLTILKDEGLVRFHDIRTPARRGFFLNGWPHVATILVEKESGERYVIDSTFLDSGGQAYVVPYKQWKSGWRPEKR